MGTHIEWTDETWNPTTGCDKVSSGCDQCYIERTIPFRMEGRAFDEHGRMGVRLHPDRLDKPLHWRKPRRVFVNSLSDLFHKDVPDEFIVKVFHVMAYARDHTFQILTKRPQRMAALLARWERAGMLFGAEAPGVGTTRPRPPYYGSPLPLPNVWLGVSVENQRYADLRIPHLLATPAAVRFLSCEPLLGPVEVRSALADPGDGWDYVCQPHGMPDCRQTVECSGLQWVIVGGESGPGARPMHPAWARSIRDECQEAGVPFFFKQWGEWREAQNGEEPGSRHEFPGTTPSGLFYAPSAIMAKVGKRAAGRELDGRTWDEYPC